MAGVVMAIISAALLITGKWLVALVESGRCLALEGEFREIRYAAFAADQFLKSVSLTPAERAGWYEKNGTQFVTPETSRMGFISAWPHDVYFSVPPEMGGLPHRLGGGLSRVYCGSHPGRWGGKYPHLAR